MFTRSHCLLATVLLMGAALILVGNATTQITWGQGVTNPRPTDPRQVAPRQVAPRQVAPRQIGPNRPQNPRVARTPAGPDNRQPVAGPPRRPAGPQVAPRQNPQGRVQQARTPQRPFPQLTPEHLAYIDRVLAFWEQKSKNIKRYRCTFHRWEYDPVFGPQDVDPQTGQKFAKTHETGQIKYSSPDKGLFKVTEILHYQKPAKPNTNPWVKIPGEHGEHWVCDGTTVFEFDHRKKTMYERRLPQEMQGRAIADGPLPFLFGAEKEKIKQRYWVRVVTPSTVKKEYWLEAFPKTIADAANFYKLRVIIDEEHWLPLAIQVFPRGYHPRTNPALTSYLFKEREVNWNQLPDQLNIFKRAFYRPPVPSGWRKEVQNYGGPAETRAAQAPQQPKRR